jgi:hypothetical protein
LVLKEAKMQSKSQRSLPKEATNEYGFPHQNYKTKIVMERLGTDLGQIIRPTGMTKTTGQALTRKFFDMALSQKVGPKLNDRALSQLKD